MISMPHRLQCNKPTFTNHKFQTESLTNLIYLGEEHVIASFHVQEQPGLSSSPGTLVRTFRTHSSLERIRGLDVVTVREKEGVGGGEGAGGDWSERDTLKVKALKT